MKLPAALLLSGLLTCQGMAMAETSPDSSKAVSTARLAAEVRAAESAFAGTMADRNFEAFASFLDQECIFFGSAGALRGPSAVQEAWKRFYEEPKAPFSWQPETVEVLDSGTLALSSGPVLNPSGTPIATFNSIWRRQPDGSWKVVFDKGCPLGADSKKE